MGQKRPKLPWLPAEKVPPSKGSSLCHKRPLVRQTERGMFCGSSGRCGNPDFGASKLFDGATRSWRTVSASIPLTSTTMAAQGAGCAKGALIGAARSTLKISDMRERLPKRRTLPSCQARRLRKYHRQFPLQDVRFLLRSPCASRLLSKRQVLEIQGPYGRVWN
jgi:hypothetical protein